MTERQAAWRVAIVLVLLGAAAIGARRKFQHEAPVSVGDSFWRLTYNIGFHARKNDAKVRVSLPLDTHYARVFAHKTPPADLTVEQPRSRHGETREIVVTAPKPGPHRLTVQIDVHLSERPGWRPNLPSASLSSDLRSHLLRDEKGIEASDPVVRRTVEQLRGGQTSKADLVERFCSHCEFDLSAVGPDDPQTAAAALQKGVASPLGRARALTALCRAAQIPARLVTGFEIRRDNDLRPHVWVETLAGNSWESYDPEVGYRREMPHDFVPVRRDGTDIVRSDEATDMAVKYSLAPMPPPAGAVDLQSHQPLDILCLTRLPIELHPVLQVVLLLPLGALVTAVMRTIIGLRTFGTFTPTLLALSFVYNDWRTGVLVLIFVLILGLSSRNLLDRLKLLLVPRLGIILTLVVLCMVFSISLLDYLGRTPGPQTVLLPMVILTMLVERFYVTTEEDSMRFAAQLLAGTLALAFVVYALLRWKTVGEKLLEYPEIHVFTVVALILVGRYTGYRLTELWRFRDLGPGKE